VRCVLSASAGVGPRPPSPRWSTRRTPRPGSRARSASSAPPWPRRTCLPAAPRAASSRMTCSPAITARRPRRLRRPGVLGRREGSPRRAARGASPRPRAGGPAVTSRAAPLTQESDGVPSLKGARGERAGAGRRQTGADGLNGVWSGRYQMSRQPSARQRTHRWPWPGSRAAGGQSHGIHPTMTRPGPHG
jgi:hypothetical protein